MKVIKNIILLLMFVFTYASSEELQKVSIQLNWKYQFEFAGFIAAKEKGFYKDYGFDVELKEYKKNINIREDIENQISTFGIFDSSVLRKYNPNKPLVLLANYFKKSPLIFIAQKDIFLPSDIKNKNVMITSFEFDDSVLSKLLENFKIKKDHIKIKPHSYNLEDFMEKKVDVMSAYITNELYTLDKNNIQYNIINPMNYEVFGLGSNLFTSMEFIKNNKVKVSAFIKATNKGWKYALNNKEEIIKLIYNKYSNEKSIDALKYEANRVENLMMPHVYKIGSIKKELIQNQLKEAKALNKVPKSLLLSDIIYNLSKYSEKYNFTKEEINYLKNKKEIKMCVDPNWMPYEKIENGKHIGIISDYISFFEEKLSTQIKLVSTKTWAESLVYVKSKKCDIVSALMNTKERREFLNITKPYLDVPLVIATKNSKRFINNIDEIINKEKIGIVSSYAYSQILKKRFPDNKIVDIMTVEDGLRRVTNDEIFGVIDSISSIGYNLQKDYYSDLKIDGKFKEKYEIGVGVIKDDLILFNIFNKLINNLDEKTKQNIYNKWSNINYEEHKDYSLLLKTIVIFVIIILIITYRYKEVLQNKKKLQEQQKILEQKNNELKKTKKALEESVGNFKVLLDSTMEAVLVFREHECIDINKVGWKLLGYKNKKEVIGKDLYHHVHESSIVNLKESLNKNLESYEVEFVKLDGNSFPALVKDRFIRLNGEVLKLIAIVDLTELKNKEKLFFKQSKLASMGEMIGNIAHQWRQPLSLISTVSTGLKLKIETGLENKEESIEFLEKLNSTAQHLSATIDDFRNFFATNKVQERFYVKELIDQNLVLLDSIFKTNFVNVVLNIPKDLQLYTFKNELTQAILNILNNSNDALKELSFEMERYIFIDAYKKENNIIINIKDNAKGIPLDVIDKIFEPYFTTKHKSNGTGIGLYMTYQIVSEHIQGKIEVKNLSYKIKDEIHKGANFIITLPIDENFK